MTMPATIRPVWAHEASTNFSRGVIIGDTVIYGDMDGTVGALRRTDGELVWQVDMPGVGVREDLSQFFNIVFGASINGPPERRKTNLFAIAGATGSEIWTLTLDQWSYSGLLPTGGSYSAYISDDSNGGDYVLHALSEIEGRVVASHSLGPKRPMDFALRDQELVYAVEGSRELRAVNIFTGVSRQLYVATRPIERILLTEGLAYLSLGDTLLNVDLLTGQARWTAFLDATCSGMHLLDDMLIIGTYKTDSSGRQLHTAADTAEVRRLESATGVERWRFAFGTQSPGTPALAGSTKLLVTMARRPSNPWLATFFVLDVRTGEALMSSEQPGRPEWIFHTPEASIVSHGDFIYGFDVDRIWGRKLSHAVRGVDCNDTSILALTSAGAVDAFTRDFGDPQWSTPLAAPLSPRVATARGLVMVGDANGLVALDQRDGHRRWRFGTTKPVASPPVVAGDNVVFGCRDEFVRALRIADGTLVWEFKTDGFVDGAAAVSSSGLIYVTSGDGSLYCLNADGTQRWRYEANEVLRCRPLIGRSAIVFGDTAGYVHAVNVESGVIRWKQQIGSSFSAGPVGMADGSFWIAEDSRGAEGVTSLYRVAETDGEVLDAHSFEGMPVLGELVVAGSKLVMGLEAGVVRVTDLSVEQGTEMHHLKDRSHSGVAFAGTGIVAGDESGNLYFLLP